MPFSRRSAFELDENRLARTLSQRRAAGLKVYDLNQSNPTRVGFREPQAQALRALGDEQGLHYSPEARGLLSARSAVSSYYADRGAELGVDSLFLTSSTSEAYAYAFKLLCDAGDNVLMPTPSYPLVQYLAGLESVELRAYRLEYDQRWRLDFSSLEASRTKRTRAVVVVAPNNPTGSVLTADEWRRLDAWACEHDLAILSDEVFADFVHPRGASPTIAAASSDALSLTLSGLSKICGLPQLKLGWMAVGGRAHVRDELCARLELIADTYLSVATPVQLALPELLRNRRGFQAECLARISTNLKLLESWVSSDSSRQLLQRDGGWHAMLRVPRLESEEDLVCGLLERTGVYVHPGYFYELERETHIVLSLIIETRELSHGLDMLADHLES